MYKVLISNSVKNKIRSIDEYQISNIGNYNFSKNLMCEIERIVSRLASNPFLYQIVYGDTRRVVIRYQYTIYYHVDKNIVYIDYLKGRGENNVRFNNLSTDAECVKTK